jgi:hypothetical protein
MEWFFEKDDAKGATAIGAFIARVLTGGRRG